MQHVISCHEGIRRECVDTSQHIELDIRQLLEVRADSLAVRNRFPAKLSARPVAIYSPTVQQDQHHTETELIHRYRVVGDAGH